ncbi:tRNA (cytosine(38)-C(5))-methyltransferase isoform X1 [Pleuronectes platessa]|uniref:tRNA (cytosine(38)-C(5))-methyltransferase isoform X1 n=1 Tax=Pleuronectes platessa TaxID=8262 RepID=UPI00232A2123|nr:tRNA (cytosine(38)-C(5))-methyltransferase isoform X1 [Pleuronectes platessa]XP_053268173.1 tRNA (cytosine(38)-C(5))-methyltransferase isoform X1 [Pleuronectes platessa]
MSGFLIGRTSCTPQQASVLTDSVLNMLVTDMRPLSMVEDDGFRTMIHTFYPGYTLPSRTHFTRLMERKYEQTFNAVKTALNNGNNSKLALTTDVWTSVAIEAYLGVTCHYITDDWEMKSICLTTMPLQDRHTGSNIAEWLEEVVARFEIPPSNIIAVVHDNGANVVAAARILEEKNGWSSVRCTGHTLQLVINAALKHPSIEKAVGAARCLVEHFKKSELASGKLRAKQQQMATPEHSLVQDVSTRWNSTFYMVSRLIEQRWPVTATLSDISVTQKGKRYLDLKPEQWILLEELLKALKPFECATVFMTAEKYTTISAIPPLVKGLLKSTESAAYESGPLQAFQVTATNQLQERWKRETTFSDTAAANTVILASAFDPRFRKLKFLSPEEIVCVQNKVQRLALGEMERNLQQPDTSSDTASASTTPTTLLDSLLGSSSEEGDGSSGDDDVNTKVREEVLRYFGEKKLSKEENPLQWWKNNMDKYPIMARLAKSYLCIPGTSTPSERLFSAAGNIASKKRASLSQEHVDMLTFLHCNAKFMPKTVN